MPLAPRFLLPFCSAATAAGNTSLDGLVYGVTTGKSSDVPHRTIRNTGTVHFLLRTPYRAAGESLFSISKFSSHTCRDQQHLVYEVLALRKQHTTDGTMRWPNNFRRRTNTRELRILEIGR
uniref:Putative secreted peptide n=1 Tax=Anopheles braziliensis TaxID=58242 RepID=A0A2M3ZUD2_9DIPT